MKVAPHEVTRLLRQWSEGDQAALDRLIPLVYEELHRLAHQHMRREKPGNYLQTSALINEVYLRMVDQPQIRWENRSHFFGIAARLMRRILVDEARKRNLLNAVDTCSGFLCMKLQILHWSRPKMLWRLTTLCRISKKLTRVKVRLSNCVFFVG